MDVTFYDMAQVTPADGTTRSARDFRLLWTGTTVASFGAEIAEIALPLLALLTLSATAGELSALRIAQFLPFLVATLPLGLVVDRFARHRLRLLIGADLGRFVLIGSIPPAVWIGVTGLHWLYAVVFLAGVLTVLFELASFAVLPHVVPPDWLVHANGRLEASKSASSIAGRGVGGAAVQALTAPVAVAANAVGHLVSALCLSRIRVDLAHDLATRTAENARTAENRSRDDQNPTSTTAKAASATSGIGAAWRETFDGLKTTLANRYLRPLLFEATTFNLGNEILVLGLMLWAVRDLGLGAATIGLVFTVGGLGSFVGAWLGGHLTGRFGYGRVLLITLILGNTAPLALLAAGDTGGTAALALLWTVFATMGFGIGIANVHAVSLRQRAVPGHLTGRTNAAYRLISWGAIPIGAGLGGVLAEAYDGRTAMLIGAAVIATATFWVGFSTIPRLRSIDEAAPRQSDQTGREAVDDASRR